jgi:hypothetical protein
VKTLAWRRNDLIERVRQDLWRYLTPAADIETEALHAAALLQMRPSELRTLGAIQFLISRELGLLLDYMPFLLRLLATTTAYEEEVSAERIGGAIQWGRTVGLRCASGAPHLYVTAPSRRAYQTPENELLVFLLDQAVILGRLVGWHRSSSEVVGRLINHRVIAAERWSQSRMLLEIERRPIHARALARIRSGRFRRRYQPVWDAWERYTALVGRLDRASIRHAIETYGLVTRSNPTLFELYCTFETLRALEKLGWRIERLGLVAGSLALRARRRGEVLDIVYQATPKHLGATSRYRRVQQTHAISPGGLRPDLVLRRSGSGPARWLLVEVKGGERRTIEDSARAALRDLLAYRAAFTDALADGPTPYGLGIAWGAELEPSIEDDVMLCSPELIGQALEVVFA